jgi:hypothetical protein
MIVIVQKLVADKSFMLVLRGANGTEFPGRTEDQELYYLSKDEALVETLG